MRHQRSRWCWCLSPWLIRQLELPEMLGAKMSELDVALSLRVSWLVDVGDEIVVDDQAVDVTSRSCR